MKRQLILVDEPKYVFSVIKKMSKPIKKLICCLSSPIREMHYYANNTLD
ncbi:putative adenosylcobalamin-dependent ribonucleoside-triphosphate reductase [Gossypium arboreum]|uniref:Putative adenosylcobalamin-dependent ribonucleoside-triphosphate reductase n=1 Tax=Gossypium arboreum TaxID=29729 RepID=A0A0B0N204_GOSAR|nr:putative adenosylcobalamin-dependent ribonucleoside-triphosphate reductase [Gossypium arboreum]